MRSVGLKLLKNRLSEYVRLAAGGETVLVTDRDRVVAEIGPPRPGRSQHLLDALLAEAGREGWLTPPLLAGGEAPPRQPVATFQELMGDLRHARGEGVSTSIRGSRWRPSWPKIVRRPPPFGVSRWSRAACWNMKPGIEFTPP